VRLLFDEQLSEELVVLLRDIFPDSLHVRPLGVCGSADQRVWQLAREHDAFLVTKDEDSGRL
jgi:predicted nuclease of predicted toxin-antitoxin system